MLQESENYRDRFPIFVVCLSKITGFSDLFSFVCCLRLNHINRRCFLTGLANHNYVIRQTKF